MDRVEDLEEAFEDADNDTLEGVEFTKEDEGDRFICIIQRLLFAPKESKPTQRHNIFRTKCTINKKVCEVIIGSGSSENVVLRALVKLWDFQPASIQNITRWDTLKGGHKKR